MNKLLRKKLTRGGFTLAELLIVVAIIAILVAIAIPIFTGALEKARIAVHEANIRSVKSAAVYKILMNDDEMAKKGTVGWYAVAKVSANGDLLELDIYGANETRTDGVSKQYSDPANASAYTEPSKAGSISVPDGGYYVRVTLTEVDLTKGHTT